MCKLFPQANNRSSVIFSRISVGIVLFVNVHCSLVFILFPNTYQRSFELSVDTGVYFIQALGILFIMWNIPYAFAFIDPMKFKTSYLESIIMQLIGTIGETFLMISIPTQHALLRVSIFRFLIFDCFGLLLLIFGYSSIKKEKVSSQSIKIRH